MSLIKRTVAAGVPESRAITADHIAVENAPGPLSIKIETSNGSRTYVLEAGGNVATGPYTSITYSCETSGLVKMQATIGRYTSTKLQIDPAANSVSMAETVEVTIDEIGLTPTKNTVKIDPLNNAVDISGQTVDVSGQTVDVSGQTVDVSGQTVDVSGQTVDIAGQTVDVSGQEVVSKTKSSTAIANGNKTVSVTGELFPAVAGGSRVTYRPIDGKIWIGPAGVSKVDGYPVEQNEVMEWDTESALHAVSDTGDDVDVRVLKESF